RPPAQRHKLAPRVDNPGQVAQTLAAPRRQPGIPPPPAALAQGRLHNQAHQRGSPYPAKLPAPQWTLPPPRIPPPQTPMRMEQQRERAAPESPALLLPAQPPEPPHPGMRKQKLLLQGE